MSLDIDPLKHDSDILVKEENFHDTFLNDHLLDPEEPVLKKSARKKLPSTLRKAPNAPKRFKSSYICFFMEKQPSIKEELGPDAAVTSISKRSAEMWKSLSPEERAIWDEVAAQDKQRYMMEKSQYTGPWQVPWKRLKKDPSAPKRPMSAFLYFSQGKRAQIKKDKPDIKNTEVSRLLGEMWRNLTDEERAPHIERERSEREAYKIAIAEWREHHEAMKQLEGDRDIELSLENNDLLHMDHLGNPFTVPCHQIFPPQYQFPINGKQPVILGPKGIPYATSQVLPASLQTQKSMQVGPAIFDDNAGLLSLQNHNFDYSSDHLGGEAHT